MSDYALLLNVYKIADYLYKPTDYKSKFVSDCQSEGGNDTILAITNALFKELEDPSHSERETELVDHVISIFTSLYLYSAVAKPENVTEICVNAAHVIRDYANCVFTKDKDERREALKELEKSLSSARFSLEYDIRNKSGTDIKLVAYSIVVRHTLDNVYKSIESYINIEEAFDL